MIKSILSQMVSLALLFVLAAIPLIFYNFNGEIIFRPETIPELVKNFLSGLMSGESFYYHSGSSQRNLLEDFGSYFLSSYLYLASSGAIVMILAFIFGIRLWKISERYMNGVLSFLGMIPDFIFILLLQLSVNGIYKSTGIKVAKVASLSSDNPAVLLPIITLVIIPFVYLTRTLNDRTHEVSQEDYITTALAKGLNRRQIYFYHVTSNVLPFFKADLHKVTSIMISNLFVVEYLYNTRGITALLFQLQNKFGYQYNVVILCFLALLLLYIAVYFSFRLFIAIVEGALKHA